MEELTAVVARAQAVLARELTRVWPQVGEGDLGQIERVVQAALRPVGAAVVEGAVARREAQDTPRRPRCGSCGRRLRLVARRGRVLAGLVGEYRLRRAYYQCRRCKGGVAPLDAALGLGSEYCAPGLAAVACRLGIETAFVLVPELVRATLGTAVDAETVRRLVERVGAVAELAQERQVVWGLASAPAPPPLLLVSVDGVFVPERDGWHEAKVGRLAALGPAVRRDRKTGRLSWQLGASAYCVSLEEADRFWVRLAREAARAGLGRGVRTVVLLADGAAWIWLAGRSHLGLAGVEVVEIGDYYHACEHLGTVASAVFAHTPLRRSAWLVPLRRRLRDHGVAPVLRALAKLRPTTVLGREEVRRPLAYFTEHAARMDYPAFAARQFPIGSGAIESTCRHLVQLRAVQAGMRWLPGNLQAVLSLRAVHRSARWAAFWADRPLLRAQQHRAAAAGVAAAAAKAPTTAPPAPPTPHNPSTAAPSTAPPPPAAATAPPRPWQPGRHPWRGRALSYEQSA